MSETGSENRSRAFVEAFSLRTALWMDAAPGQDNKASQRRQQGRPKPAAKALKALAEVCGLPPETVAVGSWALLLARYARESEVAFGVVTGAGAPVPLRVQVDWDASVTEWLRSLQSVGAALAQGDGARAPRIEETAHHSLLALGKRSAIAKHATWPLIVGVSPDGSIFLDADADRFDDWVLEQLAEHLELALAAMLQDPTRTLGSVSLVSQRAREQLLGQWNKVSGPHPNATIPELFARQAQARADAPAILSARGNLTYGELEVRANRLAHYLQRLGVGPDVPVAVCMESTPDRIVALLGILKAGGAYVALNATYPAERLAFITQDSRAKVVLADRSQAAVLPAFACPTLVLEELAKELQGESASAPVNQATIKNLANIIYTSGSTGTPKGVEVTHAGFHRITTADFWLQVGPDHTFLQTSAITFDVSGLDIWTPLLTGARCALHDEAVPTGRGIAASIARFGVTRIATTVALFNAIVDDNPNCLQGVRQIQVGGEAISPSHVRRAYASVPELQVTNCYGPTECTVVATAYAVPRDLPEQTDKLPIGVPILDTQAYVLDDQLNLLPIGVVGELCLGGPGLARGYLRRPELTAKSFPAHALGEREKDEQRLYRTGDLVRWLRDGSLDFVGRVDSQVKIRGFRIEIGEIEACLMRHPSVASAFVLARGEQPELKRLVAYLVAREGQEEVGLTSLQKFLATTLPDFMVPSALVWMKAFPLTTNGKVDVRLLPAPIAARPDLDVDFIAPTSRTEHYLCELFGAQLGLPEIGIRDNFFELGGNSLHALKVLAKIREALKVDVPVVSFFQQPTVEATATLIDVGVPATAGSAAPGARFTRRSADGKQSDIAVIAMGGRFPGARSVEKFWQNLCAGVDSITHFAPGELDPAIPSYLTSDANYIAARGILDDVELFDAAFFGISPREAEIIDPQHRLLLEVAWEVLEEAGYTTDRYKGRIGVFAGTCADTYLHNHVHPRVDIMRLWGEFQATVANDKDFAPTRIAYKLNLTGPAVSVQTACSTSLVATVEAFSSLRTYQCDMALAGGANITCPPKCGYLYQEGAMLSPDGVTRTFDVNGRGTVFSDGVTMLLLKRLEDALADGDTIYGVIKGAAINNDGAYKASFTAPSVDGQAAVIEMAQDMAGFDPESVGYVETHGTATPLGDPIEVAALTRVFSRTTQKPHFCAIGSLKTNVGHMVNAAGAAGVIKVVLALHHGKLPASLHFTEPNPRLGLEGSPFFVNAALNAWPKGDVPRRAGVSSFGVGGTNAHVAIEEAPPQQPTGSARSQKLVLLSARTASALDAMTERLRAHLAAHPELDLADVAHTLMVGRKGFSHRRAIVAADNAEAIRLLGAPSPPAAQTRELRAKAPDLAFLFPGQGAQYVRMGYGLYQEEPTYRAVVDYCAELLQQPLGRDLRKLLFPATEDEAAATESLQHTAITQPALFVTSYALAQLWMAWGVRPGAMIGHSVGEFVAAALSGVMSLEDALRLVAERGRMMGAQPAGAMLSVRLPAESVVDLLWGDLAIASDNGPSLCVVAGPSEDIAKLESQMAAREVVCRLLRTSHAFHSPMMDSVVEPFAKIAREVKLHEPSIPFVSTVTGSWIRGQEATDPEYWARHLRATVRFRQGIATLLAEPRWGLLEVGPRATLSTLARQQTKEPARLITASLGQEGDTSEATALLRTAGRLWIHGVELDGEAFHVHETRRRVSLPTYPFERKRYWIDPTVPATQSESAPRPSVVSGGPPAPAEAPAPAALPPGSLAPALGSPAPTVPPPAAPPGYPMVPPGYPMAPLGYPMVPPGVPTGVPGPWGAFPLVAPMLLPWVAAQMAAQRQMMATWMAMQGQQPQPSLPTTSAPAAAPPVTASASAPAPAPAPPVTGPADAPAQAAAQAPSQKQSNVKEAFGAMARIHAIARDDASPRQKAHLEAFIRRYTTRTKSSKEFAQRNRGRVADPRAVTGFRPNIKELIYPIVAKRSKGAYLWDLDDNQYIDALNGFGANYFGWQPDFITEAVRRQLDASVTIGPQTPLVEEVAERFCRMTGHERAAFCNTGSEAVLGCMRMARTVTGRSTIAIFTGSYHGIFDEVIVRAIKNQKAYPAAPGILPSTAENILVLDYGSEASLEIIRSRAQELAAVMVEPIQSRHPETKPREFIQEVRALTAKNDIAFIFDEVITGFRTGPKGAQGYYGVQADLASYGKVIGGGYSLGVIGGKSVFLDALDGGLWQFGDDSTPTAGVTYFAGTFVRHPLAMAAARAVLEYLEREGPGVQERLNERTAALARSLDQLFIELDAPLFMKHFSTLWQPYFREEQPYGDLLAYMLRDRGIHCFHGFPNFLTLAHTDADIAAMVKAYREALLEMQEGGFLPEPGSSKVRNPT